jgi:hypothetical protein
MRRLILAIALLLFGDGAVLAQTAERPSTFIAAPWTWSAVQTFNDGDLSLAGSTSGNSVLHASATGGGAVTFFSGSDTVAGKSLANGGTNASLTASNGGLVYSSGSALAILSGTATANQIPLSGSNTTPAWSTATYPATTTANQLLYSSATNTIGGLATANNAILVTNGSGVPSLGTALPAGITGTLADSVTTGVSAAGTTLGTATGLTTNVSVIGTCAANAGVTLPAITVGTRYVVTNQGANVCNIYPDTSGHKINSLANGTAIAVATDTTAAFEGVTTSAYVSIP